MLDNGYLQFNCKIAHFLQKQAMHSPQIDMICFNQNCITNKQQLFQYHSQARALHDSHADLECVNIHPHNFNRKYARQATALREVRESLDSSLGFIIQEMTARFVGFMRQRLRERANDLYDCQLSEFRPSNCHSLLDKIKKQEGQYEVEVLNCLFLEDQQAMRRLADAKVSKCQENLTTYLEQLQSRFTNSFEDILQSNPQTPPKKTQPQSSKIQVEQSIKVEGEVVELSSQSLQVEQEPFLLSQKEKQVSQQNNINSSNIVERRQDPNNDIRKYFKRKEKPIHKESKPEAIFRRPDPANRISAPSYIPRMSAPTYTRMMVPMRIGRITAPVTTGIRTKSYTIRNESDLAEAQQQMACRELIVYYPLSEERLVKLVEQLIPQEVYLNYEIKLSSDFIDSINSDQLVKFEEFWDHCKFFDEVINKQYFPTDDFRFIESVYKLHFSIKQWNSLSLLTNAWMSNYYDMEQLRHSKKKITDIESLRVEGCRCCNNLNQYAITEIFRAFKESSSLKTFVLKCDALNEENIKLLREMTLRNKNITCLIIQIEGKYIPTKVLEAFCKLPLTTLSINCEQNNEGDNVYMDINPIIHIKTLRKLAITNMFFTNEETIPNQSTNMEQILCDEKVATKISQLTELVFLDLFRCSPIYSTIVSELTPRVKNGLYHLNLSHTLMDSSIIPQLQQLPRLEELNLDRTSLNLKELFRELHKSPLTTVRKLSLYHYNGDDLDKVDVIGTTVRSLVKFSELNNQQIDKISTCFPNLEYLNIAFCCHFSELADFKFKKLKYLCSNKEFMGSGKIEKMKHHRGIDVYLYDGVHNPWKILDPNSKTN